MPTQAHETVYDVLGLQRLQVSVVLLHFLTCAQLVIVQGPHVAHRLFKHSQRSILAYSATAVSTSSIGRVPNSNISPPSPASPR